MEEDISMKELWYTQEALGFTEALPIGCGNLGGMVYGGTKEEKISLNEDTLWSGFPGMQVPNGKYTDVQEAEKIFHQNGSREAEYNIWKKCLSGWSAAYQPAGTLRLAFENVSDAVEYRRHLNLDEAVAVTEYKSQGCTFWREVFCSFPDQVMAIHCTAKDKLTKVVVSLDIPHPARLVNNDSLLTYRSIAPVYSAPNYFACENPIVYDAFESNRALSYAIAVKPIAIDGNYQIVNGNIVLEARDFVILVAIATNFERFDRSPLESKIDPLQICLGRVNHAAQLGYDLLRERHVQDYQALFNRVSFTLGGIDRSYLPTDERLRENNKDHADNGLVTLLFDYGRYLTIASSRSGTQAANLQGIWNEEMRPPWSSNYTLNINTEMNYWPTEVCALPECHEPLFNLLDGLSENGLQTARRLYNCRGWCSHHNSDLWCITEPVGQPNVTQDAVGWAYWSGSGGWLARNIWQHYEYTNDVSFLREKWNILRGAGLFLLDRLRFEEGYLITPLSTSPENRYLADKTVCCLSENCAIDIGITMDVLGICILAAKVLDLEDEAVSDMEKALKKMKGYVIGSKGQLLEWGQEYQEDDLHHRHISPLYGVYPGDSITPSTPELYRAAEQLMRFRGNEATGWGIAWKVNVWARLKNGKEAKECLDKAMRFVSEMDCSYHGGGGIYANLLDAHPPFQIDGNMGILAGICEMLVQSTSSEPELLPALPKEWPSGSIRGLKIKGGRTLSFCWENGVVSNCLIE